MNINITQYCSGILTSSTVTNTIYNTLWADIDYYLYRIYGHHKGSLDRTTVVYQDVEESSQTGRLIPPVAASSAHFVVALMCIRLGDPICQHQKDEPWFNMESWSHHIKIRISQFDPIDLSFAYNDLINWITSLF